MVKFKNPKKITQKSIKGFGGGRYVEYSKGGKTYQSSSITNPIKGAKKPGLMTGRVKKDGSLGSININWQAFSGKANAKKANLIRGGATNSGRSSSVKRSSGGSTG